MPFFELRIGEDGPAREPTRDSVGFFRPAREYEFDKASLEERFAGPIMDAVRALTPADYLGLSTVGCIPTEDMIASLVRLQTMVNCFLFSFCVWLLMFYFLSFFFARQQLVDTLALYDQHRDFHRNQVPVMAGLRQRISELELELAQSLSLESEVARLSKLLAERES